MEIKGKVLVKPATDFGNSSRGPWRKAYLVIRYEEGQYPKDILLSNMKKAEDFEKIRVGETGTFKFDARTKQSAGGKWFCDLECWSWALDRSSPSAPPPSSSDEPF